MERLRPDDPETIGQYTLVARLGSGGMGVVFLAKAGAQSVALKVVRTSYLDNKSLHARFVREIETLKKINSPYVAKIFDYAVEEDTAWHAVEFVAGPSLKEKIDADGPLEPAQWNDVADQLQRALADIHALGIVHRDIKPANIVLGETGIKLIDFGIAQDDDATSVTVTGSIAGSPAWLSPERLEGIDDDPASDLFSAGAVLTFAATGKSPWGDSETTTVSAVITRIVAGTPDLTGLTDAQRQVVDGLLHSNPRERRWVTPTRFSAAGSPSSSSSKASVGAAVASPGSTSAGTTQASGSRKDSYVGGGKSESADGNRPAGFPTLKTLFQAIRTPLFMVLSVVGVLSLLGTIGIADDGVFGFVIIALFGVLVVALVLAARQTWKFREGISLATAILLTIGVQLALLGAGVIFLIVLAILFAFLFF